MAMRMSSSPFSPGSYKMRRPINFFEAVRLYFTILFGVAVSMLAFYYLFPHS